MYREKKKFKGNVETESWEKTKKSSYIWYTERAEWFNILPGK